MEFDRVTKLCQDTRTVASEQTKDPKRAPAEIFKELFGKGARSGAALELAEEKKGREKKSRGQPSADALAKARQCGNWGPTQPSDLFLCGFHDALACLEINPLVGMTSPSLLGRYGTIPLTIIAPLADIIRHMSNLIVRAQREVILITCSWSKSIGSGLIHDALLELSRRAGQRGEKVVVKIMYDQAGLSHATNDRVRVKESTYAGKGVGLPKAADVPNLEYEVVNFHKIVLGTLHAKFMVVDRKVAVVESNNMEDNDNMEMMVELEGPIVDSVLDTALVTWGFGPRVFDPIESASGTAPSQDHTGEATATMKTTTALAAENAETAREQHQIVADGDHANLPIHNPGDPHYDETIAGEIDRSQFEYSPKHAETRLQAINRLLNIGAHTKVPPSGPEIAAGEEFTPYIPHDVSQTCPIAMVSRPPYGPPDNGDIYVPQDEAWLSLIYNAQKSIFIQTPDLNATPLYDALHSALSRGVEVTYYVCLGYNDAGELMPGQGGINEMFAAKLTARLTPEERKLLHVGWYVGKDQDRPLHHSSQSRSCHIKLLIADDHVGIQGSGNQDTQSWCHSQEINIMVDSPEVCRKWREGIERNQNTAKFGMSSDQGDGLWRDAQGKEAPGSTGTPSAPVGWIKGVVGMVKKAQDKGQFHA